jgi:sec-independent protein translocase protein TatA
MWSPSIPELVIILIVALLVFGPKKLPEMGKAIGSAVTEFKKGISGQADHDSSKAAEAKKIEEAKPEEKKPSEPAG